MHKLWRPVAGFLLLAILLFSRFLPPESYTEERTKEAAYYQQLDKEMVHCQLCPRRCIIPPGRRGFCGVRENRGGKLYALSYAKLVSLTTEDPIEKKPLFHYLPGVKTFSLATAGCNLRCKFCQNWEISQRRPEELRYEYLEPEALIQAALASGRPVVAYTYTEPVVFYEYMLDCAKLARQAGLRNIMHSNGYVNPEPLAELAEYLDAANIDLKGFSEEYYAGLTEGSLAPVLESLKVLKRAGVFVEITNLVVPGYNDDPVVIAQMCRWIRDNLGADTPLHFSRFQPMYKLLALNPTPVEVLEKARQIALDAGLRYVYIGNLPGHQAENTYCPKCGKIVLRRLGMSTAENNLVEGKCKFCGEEICGVWK